MTDNSEIEHLAQLARVEIDDEERLEIVSHLQRILEFMAMLEEVDTTDIPLFVHASAPAISRREDCAEDAFVDADGSFFVVPHIWKSTNSPHCK